MTTAVMLGRRYRFHAAHRLYNDQLSEAENTALYYKCSANHGHTYNVDVVVSGTPDPATHRLMETQQLDSLVESVLDRLDFKQLETVTELSDQITSTENLVQLLFDQLSSLVTTETTQLHRVEVAETRNNRFEAERAAHE